LQKKRREDERKMKKRMKMKMKKRMKMKEEEGMKEEQNCWSKNRKTRVTHPLGLRNSPGL
jgi:hypothetical protein